MSKKLIAVAAAAALALTSLVGVAPASAAVSVNVEGGNSSDAQGLTAAAPTIINVPSQDVLRAGGTDGESIVLYEVENSVFTSTAVRVVATGSIKLLTLAQYSADANRKATFGAQALELTTDEDGDVSFYAYTTSTQVGTVTVTLGGNNIVRHLQGSNAVGYAYNLNFTAPTTADVGGVLTLTGNVTDVFGNKIEGISEGDSAAFEAVVFGAATGLATGEDVWTESETDAGTYTVGIATSATPGSGIVGLSADVTRITGYSAPKDTVTFSFTTASLADQVALLNTQIASMRLKANSVTKKKYNTLARKWNAANPSSKVKLKK